MCIYVFYYNINLSIFYAIYLTFLTKLFLAKNLCIFNKLLYIFYFFIMLLLMYLYNVCSLYNEYIFIFFLNSI